MGKFTIEKAKWSWAKDVQSKNIYRDEEFIRTKTKDEALKAIHQLMTNPSGLTYTITVFRDGEYFTHYRHDMPCLGGLVKYKASHGDRYFMNSYFPRDIYVAFPEGEIVYIACQCIPKDRRKSPYWDFIFSEESPWIAAFGSKDSIIFHNEYFVLTNMNTDPTVFYSLMRLAGLANWYPSPYKGWDPRAELLALKTTLADPRRLAGQKPLLISGGTWADGFGYTRPFNESIFKTVIPDVFEDFGKHTGGYPQAAYTNTYFNEIMKNTFGLDLSGGVPAQKKYEGALIKAWDYFKQEAGGLDDLPGDQQRIKRTKLIRQTIKKDAQNLAILLMQVGNQQQAQY